MDIFFKILFLFCAVSSPTPSRKSTSVPKPIPIVIEFDKDKPLNVFSASQDIGGAVDGQEHGDNAIMLTRANTAAMRSAGLQAVSYRLRTELGIEAWHWNPSGKWSDEKNKQGYWISDSNSTAPINLSWGYNLPRRGNSFDEAENKGYSRIDDGDTNTFWKSNPYLDPRFTHAAESAHEQWIAVDLGKKRLVNQLVIDWADPYATDLRLEYADETSVSMFNETDELDPYRDSLWKPLPVSVIHLTHGSRATIRFSDKPVRIRVLRIVCMKSSHTALPGSTDMSDSCGFAIREVEVGLAGNHGFKDYVSHEKNNKSQSTVFASTTDPWHRATDIDLDTEQPGIDRIFSDGLVTIVPALVSAGLVYDVPENTLSLAAYLEKKHYPVEGFELGEEPDGQYISPEDFTELYIRFASMIRRAYPRLVTGGPSFQGLDYSAVKNSWPHKLVQCLVNRNALSLFQFLSFEWYPLDDLCDPAPPQLAAEPRTFSAGMKSITDSLGLPSNFPVFITESGYSVLGAEPELRMDGALLNADVIAQFFEEGGRKIYVYGWEPGNLVNEDKTCGGFGNLEFFGLGKDSAIAFRSGLFYSTWLCTQKWAHPADAEMKVYRAFCSLKNDNGDPLITAHPLYRPDGKWSVMLINKDPHKAQTISLFVHDQTTNSTSPLLLGADCYTFSETEYRWGANGNNGKPSIEKYPVETSLQMTDSGVTLPPYSITVLVEN